METIRIIKRVVALMIIVAFSSCTKYQFVDTGLANGDHNYSMWEYFSRDAFNWKLTQEFITHAGMEDLFKKTDYKITFLGFTSKSVENYLIDQGLENVSDLDVEFCQNIVKRHIITTPRMSTDVPRGNRDYDENWTLTNMGGEYYETMAGKVFMYTFQMDYEGVPEKGAVKMYYIGADDEWNEAKMIASSNIKTLTGVVHSLEYQFQLGNL